MEEKSYSHGSLLIHDLMAGAYRAACDLDVPQRKELALTFMLAAGDDELREETFNELCDAISAVLPEDYYFGMHPGDGSDLGIWKHEEEL